MPDDADHQVAGAEPKGATSTGTFKPPNFLEALKTAVQPKPRPAGRAKAQPARGTDADAKAVQYIDRRERFLAGFLGVFQLVMGVYSYFYLRSVIVKPSTHAPKLSIAQAHAQTLSDHNDALMVLIVTPALNDLRPAWREASENLGARSRQYWRCVGAPVLAPTVLGCTLLLFGFGLSAYATARALTAGTIPLTPIQIGDVMNGNVIAGQQNVGMALGLGLIVVMAIVLVLYTLLQRRASRWLSQ